jgi:replicative DNA helicase
VIAARMAKGQPADAVSIADADPDLGDFAIELTGGYVSAAQLEAHAALIVQAAEGRRIRDAGTRIAHLSGEDAFATAQAMLLECHPRTRDAVKTTRDGLREMVARLKHRLQNREKPDGLSWGIPALDAVYRPEAEHLCVIAARPKMGKTALTMQCAIGAAQSGKRVFIASLEMSLRELTERATSHLGDFPMVWLKNPVEAPDHAFARVEAGAALLDPLPLLIDDTPGLGIEQVIARATQLHMADPLGCVVVDHLGLLHRPGRKRDDLEVGDMTKALKGLAKRLKVPVLLVCQLNREAHGRDPVIKDLRDSGRIEEDMDCAVFLYRERENQGLAKALVRANRHGEEADVVMREHLARMRFEETSDEWTTARPVGNGGSGNATPLYSRRQQPRAIPRAGYGD